jgi:hypothetical protein
VGKLGTILSQLSHTLSTSRQFSVKVPSFNLIIMGKESTCPGCKTKFLNGRPYSVHIGLCKNIDSAANTVLKKHKIVTAKRFDEKKAQIAARRELAAQAAQNVGASSSQDGREIDLDVDMQEVRCAFQAF